MNATQSLCTAHDQVRVAVVNSRVFVCTLALLLHFCVALHEVISEHARVRRSLHVASHFTCARQGFMIIPAAMARLNRPAPAIKRIWPRLGEVHAEACHMTVGEICILYESLINIILEYSLYARLPRSFGRDEDPAVSRNHQLCVQSADGPGPLSS